MLTRVSKSRIVKEVGDDFGVLAAWIVIASIITVRLALLTGQGYEALRRVGVRS